MACRSRVKPMIPTTPRSPRHRRGSAADRVVVVPIAAPPPDISGTGPERLWSGRQAWVGRGSVGVCRSGRPSGQAALPDRSERADGHGVVRREDSRHVRVFFEQFTRGLITVLLGGSPFDAG